MHAARQFLKHDPKDRGIYSQMEDPAGIDN